MVTAQQAMPARRTLTGVVKRGLLAAGYYARRLARVDFPGLAVLCFHDVIRGGSDRMPFERLHVSVATFDQQCRIIARHCTPISLEDLRTALLSGRSLPPRAVLMTFDDGYYGVLANALPVLERYRIPAVVFACSGAIETGTHFWFDAASKRSGDAFTARARQLPYDEWRQVASTCQAVAGPDEAHRPLTVSELRALAGHPLIEIGSHTVNHPTLGVMPRAEQSAEVDMSCRRLGELTGRPVRAFAYPYGKPGADFTAETVEVVAEAGLDLAFTTAETFAGFGGDRLQIPRFVMLDSVDGAELAHRLAHSWHRSMPA